MENPILLAPMQIVDLFCRFAAVGVLFSLLLNSFYRAVSKITWSYAALAVCCVAYLLLTAPIANHHYGWLRPPLLLLTDLTSLALLNLYWLHTKDKIMLSALPRWVLVTGGIWLFWISYFFLFKAGRGLYHDIHHTLCLSILVYILIDAIKSFEDDLVEKRRRLRRIMITTISFYMALLTLVELAQTSLKDHWLFSLSNATAALLVSLYFSREYNLMAGRPSAESSSPLPRENTEPEPHPLIAVLTKLMKEGFYQQNGLTVNQLARELKVPAHQLRQMINTQMGFDNFTQFINSYRIPDVCEALSDPNRARDPILTIALEAGFNSIAPFNRAFRQQMGMTPSEYRDRFQK
ncbi:helix-turn-helix domain-containing protein [Lacimicrobium alkaliphilum]|uniref:Transcriptional regulator n=1 Tax=Lacimicrobium alkaliphilum TaxID=1526571 RepID=A0ABQ1RGG0_9ALTE|nr:AraC family transcriptional regulator [Lacimicrobium alkaliphilum]GGD69595.1 transcriptional regulator [Lacimicrobium alkaliphilum]